MAPPPSETPRYSYWLVKSEPAKYSWDELVADGCTDWDGVRNYAARNHLRGMGLGDLALYYHSGTVRAVVGVAQVRRTAYPDPTSPDPRWVAVDLIPLRPLAKPVTLAQIKAEPKLRDMVLVRQARLSVMPVAKEEFAHILALGETTLPLY